MRAVPDLINLALAEAGGDADNVTGMADQLGGRRPARRRRAFPPVSNAARRHHDDDRSSAADASSRSRTSPMTDSEIERAIDDIRASIRKSNKLMPKV